MKSKTRLKTLAPGGLICRSGVRSKWGTQRCRSVLTFKSIAFPRYTEPFSPAPIIEVAWNTKFPTNGHIVKEGLVTLVLSLSAVGRPVRRGRHGSMHHYLCLEHTSGAVGGGPDICGI